MKRIVCNIVLIFCLVLCGMNNPIYVEAAETGAIVKPLYVTILSTTAELSIVSNEATATTKVIAKQKCSLSITMKLQKKSGSTWVTLKTWTKSASNAISLSMSETYGVSSGTYRVYSTVTAGSETAYPTSSSVTN